VLNNKFTWKKNVKFEDISIEERKLGEFYPDIPATVKFLTSRLIHERQIPIMLMCEIRTLFLL
jgi:hypothetical protein